MNKTKPPAIGSQPVQPADLLKGALGQRVFDLAEKLVFTQPPARVEQLKSLVNFMASVSNENKLEPEQVVKTLEGMVKSAPFGVPLFFDEARLRAGVLKILGVQDSKPFMNAHGAAAPEPLALAAPGAEFPELIFAPLVIAGDLVASEAALKLLPGIQFDLLEDGVPVPKGEAVQRVLDRFTPKYGEEAVSSAILSVSKSLKADNWKQVSTNWFALCVERELAMASELGKTL